MDQFGSSFVFWFYSRWYARTQLSPGAISPPISLSISPSISPPSPLPSLPPSLSPSISPSAFLKFTRKVVEVWFDDAKRIELKAVRAYYPVLDLLGVGGLTLSGFSQEGLNKTHMLKLGTIPTKFQSVQENI